MLAFPVLPRLEVDHDRVSPVVRLVHLPPVEAVGIRVPALDVVQRIDEVVRPPAAAVA